MVDITEASVEDLKRELKGRTGRSRIHINENCYFFNDLEGMKKTAIEYIDREGRNIGNYDSHVDDYFSYLQDEIVSQHIMSLQKGMILEQVDEDNWRVVNNENFDDVLIDEDILTNVGWSNIK